MTCFAVYTVVIGRHPSCNCADARIRYKTKFHLLRMLRNCCLCKKLRSESCVALSTCMFLSQLGHALRRRTLCKHHMFVMLRVLGEHLSTYKACLAFACVKCQQLQTLHRAGSARPACMAACSN